MPPRDTSVSRIDNEAQLLRFLCASSADIGQRRKVFQWLSGYSWHGNDHRILFESIGELLARNSQAILDHLPAELTRRGFPEISCDALSASSVLSSAAALVLAEKLLRASQ